MQRQCSNCGEVFDDAGRPMDPPTQAVTCPRCNQWVFLPGQEGYYQSHTEAGSGNYAADGYGPAWELGGNWLGNFLTTIKQMLLAPEATMAAEGRPGLGYPLAFGVIVATLSGWIAAIISAIFLGGATAGMAVAGGIAGSIIAAPIFAVVGLFIISGLLHVALVIVGGASQGFMSTFRVAAYVNATSVFNIIPVVGHIISAVWGIYSGVMGLAGAHGCTKLKAGLAVIIVAAVALMFFLVGFAFTR